MGITDLLLDNKDGGGITINHDISLQRESMLNIAILLLLVLLITKLGSKIIS